MLLLYFFRPSNLPLTHLYIPHSTYQSYIGNYRPYILWLDEFHSIYKSTKPC